MILATPTNSLELSDPGLIIIPPDAFTLTGFRAWAKSGGFPRRGRFSFIDNQIVIDMSPQELSTHAAVITEIILVIAALNRDKLDLGEFFLDRTLVTNETVGLSTEPDASFATHESLESGRTRMIPRIGHEKQFLEVAGSLDWVLEVVSDSSVRKDTKRLRELYHGAGITEYWLIDARGEAIDFQILHWTPTEYVAAPRRGDFQRSNVFGRGFRLDRKLSRSGLWHYRLESRRMKTT